MERSEYYLDCHGGEMLNQLMDKSEFSREEIYKRAGLNPFFPYVINKGRRIPARDTLIQFAFGLGLSVDELNDILDFFKYSYLETHSQRDQAIITALERGISLAQAQDFLHVRNMKAIGTEV